MSPELDFEERELTAVHERTLRELPGRVTATRSGINAYRATLPKS